MGGLRWVGEEGRGVGWLMVREVMQGKETIAGGINSFRALGCRMGMRRMAIGDWKMEARRDGRCLVRVRMERAMLVLRRLMMMKMEREGMWRGEGVMRRVGRVVREGAGTDMEVLLRGCSQVAFMLLIHGRKGIEKNKGGCEGCDRGVSRDLGLEQLKPVLGNGYLGVLDKLA